MSFHNIPNRIAKRQLTAPNVREDMKHPEFSFNTGEFRKWYNHFEKLLGRF